MRGRLHRELDPEWMFRHRFVVAVLKVAVLVALGLVFAIYVLWIQLNLEAL